MAIVGRMARSRLALSIAVLGLAAPGLAACLQPPPTTRPIPARFDELEAAHTQPCLVVFLPGYGDSPEHFVRNGFIRAVRRTHARCDVVAVDAHYGYYVERTVEQRVWADVIEPARARGVRSISIVGISMGGLGAVLIAKRHPGAIDTLVLFAPYLGEPDVIDEVDHAGGLWRYRAPPVHDARASDQDVLRDVWSWLGGYARGEPGMPDLYLAFGRSDPRARSHRMLAEVLPPGHVVVRDGGHKWVVWRRMWPQLAPRLHWPRGTGTFAAWRRRIPGGAAPATPRK